MAGERFCAVSAATHVGLVRSNNEDMCALPGWTSGPGSERWSGPLAADGGWALVADGMGGHAAGEVASAAVIETLRPLTVGLWGREEVEAALREANARLYEMMADRPVLAGMGTTIAGIVLRGGSALAFNVGDSRIYHHGAVRLIQISEDHSWGGNVLTQCLGGTGEPMELDPYVRAIEWRAGDALLLCSDGLTNMVEDDQIERLLGLRLSDPAQALVEAALAGGGIDNVTAVVLQAMD